MGGRMGARSPSRSWRFPGSSGGAPAPGRRAGVLPLSLALQWGQRIGVEFPPSLEISGWLCLHCPRQCLW
eukprot:8651684-Pyramimonas_sp.AAC.1